MPGVSPYDRDALTNVKTYNLPRTAFGAGATNTVGTPASGNRIHLHFVHLTASGATVLTVKLGSAIVFEADMTANWPIEDFTPTDDVEWVGAVDALLTVTSSAAVTVGVTAGGYEATS